MNKYAIQKIYNVASDVPNSKKLRNACLKALKTSSKMQKFGSDENHEEALNNLSPAEQKEVKVGVLAHIANKVKTIVETDMGQDVLKTIKDLITTSGVAGKINKIEEKMITPSNNFEKLISDKVKSYAKASDALAFIARLTKAEKPEDIVNALDISMDEFKENISVVLGDKLTGYLTKPYQAWYQAMAEIKEVYKLYTVELAMTLLEIAVIGGIGMYIAGHHDIVHIFHALWDGVKEVITLVVVSVILMDVKDSAQFIRKQDVLIKAIPIVIVNDLIRALKWTWSKVVVFFSNIVSKVSDFFSDWLGGDDDDLTSSRTASTLVFLETLRLAEQNPKFQNKLLLALS